MANIDVLYKDSVVLFSRTEASGALVWIPRHISGVHFIADRNVVVARYGENSTDNAVLNIRYSGNRNAPIVAGKRYVEPKAFAKSTAQQQASLITFAYGEKFDILFGEAWTGSANITDSQYREGFFNYLKRNYDKVYAITTVAKYDLIPHFTITGR